MDLAATEQLSQLALNARVWWGLAGISLCLITLFTLRLGARLQLPEARGTRGLGPLQLLRLLHRSDSATASLEYLLVLFPFLIIVMTIWQLAFMFNAQLYMGYSAFAAARSAAVVIYEKKGGEAEGILNNQGTKWSSIRRAAAVGTLPISPGEVTSAAKVAAGSVAKSFLKDRSSKVNLPEVTTIAPRMSLMTLHYGDLELMTVNHRLTRTLAKSAYADMMTTVYVNGFDNRGKDVKGDTKMPEKQDLRQVDVIDVTVKYVFWLNVPFVGRMLEMAFSPAAIKAILSNLRNPYPSMILTETMSMKTWRKLRATEPC